MGQTPKIPIACSLDAAGAAKQLASWAELQPTVVQVQKTNDGARLWFRATAAPAVENVAQREAECCNFLAFHLEHEAGRVRLDITSEHPDGVAVAQLLADQVQREPSSGAL